MSDIDLDSWRYIQVFIIFDSDTGQLSEQQNLSSLITQFGTRKMDHLHFWTLGLEDWIPLNQVLTPQLIEKKKYQMPALPSMSSKTEEVVIIPIHVPPPATPVKPPPQQTPSQPPQAQKTNLDERKQPRFDVRIKVILSNKEKTFLSYTQNISLTGVLLEDVIPTDFFQNDETEIFISSPKKNEFLAFRCRTVGDQSSPRRFSFGEIPKESLTKFQEWIDHHRKDT